MRGVISHRYLYRAYAENGADGGETSMTQEISAVTWILPSGKRLHNYGKSSLLMGKSTISMAIFNSYVKLPEGNQSQSQTFAQ